MNPTYDKDFYQYIRKGSYESARRVAPLVMDLFQPRSVLDVGCGSGTWLSVFRRDHGVDDILGVDGDYVDTSVLEIPPACFRPADISKPVHLNRKFDLVISLEVAEHISAGQAPVLVENLTRHGDVILFSAAIPGQGGVHHVNEQFPEYWAALFQANGFCAVDVLREKIWNEDRIEWWYRQNILLFLKNDILEKYPGLQESIGRNSQYILTRIHPVLFFRLSYYRRMFRDFNLFRFIFSLVVKECRMGVKRLYSGMLKK